MDYVGITSIDPYMRKMEWERRGKIVVGFKVLYIGLTHEKALEWELFFRKRGYIAEPPEPKVEGKVYSVYTFQY